MDEAERAIERVGEQSIVEAVPVLPRAEVILKRLLAAHEAWFDVQRDYELAGRTFRGFAEFHSFGEQYVLSKRAKLWEVATHEYMLFDIVDELDANTLDALVEFMKTEAIKLVKPMPNHMSSNISLVVVANSLGLGVGKKIRGIRFRKNFRWGLWGWSDLRVAVVDLSSGTCGQVISNAAGKTLRATLEANLMPTANEE